MVKLLLCVLILASNAFALERCASLQKLGWHTGEYLVRTSLGNMVSPSWSKRVDVEI